MNSHQHRLIEWMLSLGEYPKGLLPWQAVHHQGRSLLGREATTTVLHAHPRCESIEKKGSQEMMVDGVDLANYEICSTCALQHIGPQATPEEIKSLTYEAHGLHRVWLWTESATSSEHVLVGRWNRELHAGVVQDVIAELRRTLGGAHSPLLRGLKEKTTERLERADREFPSTRAESIEGAIREAASAMMFFESDTTRKVPTDTHNDTQSMFYRWLGLVRTSENTANARLQLLKEPETCKLLERGVDVETLLEEWTGTYLEALGRRETTFFFASGLPSGLHGVPRSARDHIIMTGLRHRDTVWGYGELPRIVVEWLARPCGERDTKVKLIEVPHTSGLEQDVFAMALQLMREVQADRNSDGSELRTPEGALNAAILL